MHFIILTSLFDIQSSWGAGIPSITFYLSQLAGFYAVLREAIAESMIDLLKRLDRHFEHNLIYQLHFTYHSPHFIAHLQ
jgi:hypothetical protein